MLGSIGETKVNELPLSFSRNNTAFKSFFNRNNMKEYLIRFICFLTGADWRRFFPERWDLSKVEVRKEYGSNEGFVDYYKSNDRFSRFVNGVYIRFYDNTFVVKRIFGVTSSGYVSIAMNKEALIKAFK